MSLPESLPIAAQSMIGEWITGLKEIPLLYIKGIYLTGSVSLQDFYEEKSDIDFVVLCDSFPPKLLHHRIAGVHRRMEKKYRTSALNGCYITPQSLDAEKAATEKVLLFQRGALQVCAFSMAAVTLLELKTTALTLTGLPARGLRVAVTRKDVDAFLLHNINTYWKGWIEGPAFLSSRKLLLLLFPRLTEWVILGMARQLFTLQTGRITSKTGGGTYCLEHLPPEFHAVVKEALRIRKEKAGHWLSVNRSYAVRPSFSRAAATLACARYMVRLFNERYHAGTREGRY